jgi:thermitase
MPAEGRVLIAGWLLLLSMLCYDTLLWTRRPSPPQDRTIPVLQEISWSIDTLTGVQAPAYPSVPDQAWAQPERGKLDPLLGQAWHLSNVGFFDVFDELMVPKVSVKPCSHSVVVAVVDTGVDYTHPDLRGSLWSDGHGKVGKNFVYENAPPYDTNGHGTHVSGIIGAAAANGVGMTGICPGVSIMALKYFDGSDAGYNNLTNTVRAIQYAVRMGAHIINYSGGGSDPSAAERAAIVDAQKNGVLLVAAAGNYGRNNDRIPYYPASYGLDNIIGVASVNKKNELLQSSNYGSSVSIAAPGTMVLSTLPNGRFGTMSGTSQATAMVTGVAALLASQYTDDPRKHYREIRRAILDGSVPFSSKSPIGSGLLSLPGALKALR